MELQHIFGLILLLVILYFLVRKLMQVRGRVKKHYKKHKPSLKKIKHKIKNYYKPEEPLALKREEEVGLGEVHLLHNKKKKKGNFVYNHNYLNGIKDEVIDLDQVKPDNTKIIGFVDQPIKGFFTNLIFSKRSGFVQMIANMLKANPNKGYWEIFTQAQTHNREIDKDQGGPGAGV